MNTSFVITLAEVYYNIIKKGIHPELLNVKKKLQPFLNIIAKYNLNTDDIIRFREELKNFLLRLNSSYQLGMDLDSLFASEWFTKEIKNDSGINIFFCVHDAVHEILRPNTVKTFDIGTKPCSSIE